MGEVQRARLLAAAVEVVSEVGYAGMSTARVSARAGVSRKTFYELFEDREDCFLAAFDDAVARATLLVEDAVAGEASWRNQVRAGLLTLLQFIGDEPGLGALVIVSALNAGPKVLARRALWLETLARIVDRGRSEVKTGNGPPPLTAEGVVGAVLSVLHARMLAQSSRPPIELLNPLTAMVVLPYLGQAAAARELTRAGPKARRTPTRSVKDPLDGLNMRLTYRTLRVLAAVALQPGASNRELSTRAGISDEGQVSRLLTRLERFGLLRNTGAGQAMGEANAWTLTARGVDVEQALRVRTERIAR
ncbi:MAG TPA: TetR family transcriptional regulator [Polyangiaceae bacterium]